MLLTSHPLRRLTGFAVFLFLTLPAVAQQTEGMASYYADRFHAKPTSTGEEYDKHALTAASKEYPYGTLLEVTEVVSGRKVEVRVNDCGPHHPDRIIDLSRAAAQRIGLLRNGTSRVRLRVVELGELGPTCERSAWAAAQREAAQRAATATEPQVVFAPAPAPPVPTNPQPPTLQAKGPEVTRTFAPDVMLFGVQVGAFGKPANAERLAAKLTDLGYGDVWTAKVGKVHRVFTGKLYFQDEAEELKLRIREAGFRDASVRRVQ